MRSYRVGFPTTFIEIAVCVLIFTSQFLSKCCYWQATNKCDIHVNVWPKHSLFQAMRKWGKERREIKGKSCDLCQIWLFSFQYVMRHTLYFPCQLAHAQQNRPLFPRLPHVLFSRSLSVHTDLTTWEPGTGNLNVAKACFSWTLHEYQTNTEQVSV